MLSDELLRDLDAEPEDGRELERDEEPEELLDELPLLPELRLLPELFDDDPLRLCLAGDGGAMIIMIAIAVNSVKILFGLYSRIIISSINSAPAANDSPPELCCYNLSIIVAICQAIEPPDHEIGSVLLAIRISKRYSHRTHRPPPFSGTRR